MKSGVSIKGSVILKVRSMGSERLHTLMAHNIEVSGSMGRNMDRVKKQPQMVLHMRESSAKTRDMAKEG